MSTNNMFLWRNKKDSSSFRMKKAPYLLLCILILQHVFLWRFFSSFFFFFFFFFFFDLGFTALSRIFHL